MVSQEKHANNGILAYLAYHKYILQLYVSYLYAFFHGAIKGELGTISHLTVSVAQHALILEILFDMLCHTS